MQRFTDLRAWQACRAYKQAVYRLVLNSPLVSDWSRRHQLEDSVSGPPGHIAEGFGRFTPPQFAHYLTYARSSLMESQNHLIDAVDKRYITEATRLELNTLAEAALEEVTGLMEYLQSPEALRNARRARERRIATRAERLAARPPRDARPNPNPNPNPNVNPNVNPNQEPRTEPEHEPRSEKPEP